MAFIATITRWYGTDWVKISASKRLGRTSVVDAPEQGKMDIYDQHR